MKYLIIFFAALAGCTYAQNLTTVQFLLWTRENPDDYYDLLPFDEESLANSPFDGSKKSQFAFHGWTDDGMTSYIINFKNAYLQLEQGDINFISVDYEELAANPVYAPAVANMYEVANFSAQFIDYLMQNTGLVSSDIHIWGHSLGGEAAGMTGHYLQDLGVAPVDRVTGLDPAGPLFEDKEPDRRIDRTSGNFVDILHTHAGPLSSGHSGLYAAVGHVDFYPNGGENQAGCVEVAPDFLTGCSHGRSVEYWVESLTGSVPFTSEACESWDEYINGTSCVNCNGGCATMGYYVERSASGTYYLLTNEDPPFAQG